MRNKYLLLLIAIVFHVGFWVIKKPPQPSSDDLVYFQNAKSLLAGEYHLNESPKNHRLMVFGPVALLVSVFGESPWVISLWPLLCSCITLMALFLFLIKYSSPVHAFASSLLLATNTLQIDYSDSLFPDVIVAMFAFLMIIEVFKGRILSGSWRHPIIVTILFYLGFLAKEIIIFVTPFLIFVFIGDFRAKQNLSFWKRFGLTVTTGFILLIGIYYLFTGEINFIYNSVETRHSEFYALQTWQEIIKRITYGPAIMIATNVGYIILFIVAIHFVISGLLKSLKQDNPATSFFALYFLIILLTYWLSPISFSHFSFIHLDPRMWMMLLAPLYVLGGYVTSRLVYDETTKGLKLMAVLFLLTAITALILVSSQRSLMFMTFSLSAALVILIKRRFTQEKIWLTVVLLAPAIILALRFTTANSNFIDP